MAGKDVPAGTMAVVRSPVFCEPSIGETALATLIHQRRLTPSCGGQTPTAERTVGPARMIAESLIPKPGIREQNLGQRWGNRPISLWIAEEIGCCASGRW